MAALDIFNTLACDWSKEASLSVCVCVLERTRVSDLKLAFMSVLSRLLWAWWVFMYSIRAWCFNLWADGSELTLSINKNSFLSIRRPDYRGIKHVFRQNSAWEKVLTHCSYRIKKNVLIGVIPVLTLWRCYFERAVERELLYNYSMWNIIIPYLWTC